MNADRPRLVVAGLGGDSGKTLVALALSLLARERDLAVAAFKKGPDYIDAAWLTWASGRPARNLDTFLMGFDGARDAFVRHAPAGGLSVVEGNRGLYDGSDARGSHSTAELAKALGAPVLLVVNATKVTRTVAALVLGCKVLDPEVQLAGVVLNQVAGRRHERVIRDAVTEACGLPVLGALPRAQGDTLLPGRHLGLVTPEEHPAIAGLRRNILEVCGGALDLEGILEGARRAAPMAPPQEPPAVPPAGAGLRIGVVRDPAFTFYYPENLEALERAGAELVTVSALNDARLPGDLDALVIGGGFPETHAPALSANTAFLAALGGAAARGLPVYAECGGLMLLSRAIHWRGVRHPMAGALPFEVEVLPSPQGHGYVELTVEGANAFFPVGTRLKGHEFHYSRVAGRQAFPTAAAVTRGTGLGGGRDAACPGNLWAAYTHLHASGCPEWTTAVLSAASHFTLSRKR